MLIFWGLYHLKRWIIFYLLKVLLFVLKPSIHIFFFIAWEEFMLPDFDLYIDLYIWLYSIVAVGNHWPIIIDLIVLFQSLWTLRIGKLTCVLIE